jgi:aspartyl-tRNA synthetase
MHRFGIDRPDTRFGLELQDVSDIVKGVDFSIFRDALAKGGMVKCIVASGEALTRKVTDGLTEEVKGIGGGGLPLTKVVAGANGPEFSTGIAKFIQPVFGALSQKIGAKVGDTVFFMPGDFAGVCKHLHHVRTRLGEILNLIPLARWNVLWVHEFPAFGWNAEEKRWDSMHHPFTAPVDEDIPLLDSSDHATIAGIRAKAYDLVLNGTEMAGGSIRIHRRDVQAKVFRLLGISEQEAQEKFQFLMEALRFGAPPHGGIAFGFDRWVMLLSKQLSLRDVIAYPKTQRAVCPLTGAPTPVSEEQLQELHLRLQT